MTQKDLLMLLEDQRRKFSDPRIAHNFKGWNKTMVYFFPDIREYYLIEMKNGEPEPVKKLDAPLEKPDIYYEMDTETLRAMNYREINGLEAFMQKRLKLKASMPDMKKLQSLNRM